MPASAVKKEVKKMGISDATFERSIERVENILLDTRNFLRNKGKEISILLAPMSHDQIKKAKHRLRGLIGPGQVNRLVLFGRGLMSWHLVALERGISSTKFMRKPEKTRSVLNDPDATIELLTSRGVRRKFVRDLNREEIEQITDDRIGILSVKQQAHKMARMAAGHVHRRDVWEVTKMEVNGKRRGHVILEVEGPDGARFSISVRVANLRKFLD